MENPPTVTSAKSDTNPMPHDVIVWAGDSMTTVWRSFLAADGPWRGLQRPRSRGYQRVTSNAIGAVFGPQIPVGSVCVCVSEWPRHRQTPRWRTHEAMEVRIEGRFAPWRRGRFLFIAHLVRKQLSHFDPPNRRLHIWTCLLTLVLRDTCEQRSYQREDTHRKIHFLHSGIFALVQPRTSRLSRWLVTGPGPGPNRRRLTTNKNHVDEEFQLGETPPPAVLTGPGEKTPCLCSK